jgi:hypothetical protein
MKAAVGDLVRGTDDQWMVRPPQHCPSGHKLAPGRVLVGHVPCGCGRRRATSSWGTRLPNLRASVPEDRGRTGYEPRLASVRQRVKTPARVALADIVFRIEL